MPEINELSPDKRILATHKTYEEGSNINLYGTESESERGMGKPYGLWYGFGDSWLEAIYHDMPKRSNKYSNVYEIEVKGNILKLITEEEHREFFRKYKDTSSEYMTERGYIDWKKVMSEYDGIEAKGREFHEIALNQHNDRFQKDKELMWIYAWDSDSGCVWSGTVKASKLLFNRDSPDWKEVDKWGDVV